jgi:ribosome-binding protein aMBF1 (putative translation factor)
VRELKQRPSNKGYLTVAIVPLLSKRRNVAVHRLVATAFLGIKPIDLQTCHNDGNKFNNNITNLRYDTAKANNEDKIKHGTSTAGERNNTTKLTEKDVWDIRMVGRHCLDQFTRKDLAAKFNVSTSTIHLILNGKIWKNVETFI